MKKKSELSKFLLKGCMAFAILALIIFIFEKRHIFEEDNLNNHIEWKWNTVKNFSDRKVPIDVLLLGNSHLLTGVNVTDLSNQLEANCLLLGAPGVALPDLYFTLKQALMSFTPKYLLLETYAINNSEQMKLDKGALNDQINSFQARPDCWCKFTSLFSLFSYKNYGIAYINTFRNHNYIFSKPEQIKFNLQNSGPRKGVKKGLYLGQFTRFTTGLTDKTLEQYRTEGAPVNGADYTISDCSLKYLHKIADLCKEKKIQLIFVTIPMYCEHVANYDQWKSTLQKQIAPLSNYWFDFQMSNMINEKEFFQDTYSGNQHLTAKGMLASSRYISHCFRQYDLPLPSRKNESKWVINIARR